MNTHLACNKSSSIYRIKSSNITGCFTVSTIYNNIVVHMEKKGKYYKGKSDDLVSRNAHDIPIIKC